MNCKPGDLAVFVRSRAGNEGRVVRVIRLLSLEEVERRDYVLADAPYWETDTPVPTTWGWGPLQNAAPDLALRPIRDPGNDAVDESLSWAPVPRKELIPLKVRGEVS